MKRLHLIEIHDQDWCPRTVRDAETDYLQFIFSATKPYAAMVPILATALQRSSNRHVLDLCSGAAGPWLWLHPVLAEKGMSVTVCLTDKHPNLEAFGRACHLTNQAISYHPEPVDATRVPGELPGFRTMFTAFHHFCPEQACAVLADAVRKRQGIAVFEATQRSALVLLLTLPAPLMVLLVTPFIRPFRWSRLLWTYLIPLVPLVTLFDGLVSCLRTYSVQELRDLTARLDTDDYHWAIGTVKSALAPIPITYLIGVPIENAAIGQRQMRESESEQNPMPDTKHCAECEAPLPAYWPKGLCAQCALDGALAMTNAGSQVQEPKTLTITPAHLEPPGSGPESSPLGTFGDYDLLDEIARGGMGVVYKARQKNLGRIVAVKMILSGSQAGKDFVRRFRTESAAAAILQHPNIVAIHDVGVHEGRHYFSMDYVEGQDLSQRVGQQPLPANKAARCVEIIAEAIHYAHERGILHRDLKPSNVLIDSNDQPRITDFGLARRLDGDSSLTMSGQVLGSPNFMPPEQAGGKRGKVGRPSDVYALGGILYYLLTARAPFQADSLENTLTQVINAEPVSPRALNPSIPRDLETITLKCLEKEPSRRFQSAQELADELGRVLRREPIQARPVNAPEKFWRWCRRKPALASAVGLAVAALVVGLVATSWQWRRAQRNARSERHERQRAETGESNAVRQIYIDQLNLAQAAWEQNNVSRMRKLLDETASAPQRGFEWYYWQRQLHLELRALRGHTGPILAVAYSSDGRRIVTGSADKTARVWDAETGQESFQLEGHTDSVRSVAFSRDGQRIVTGSWDRTVRVWEAATGRPLRSIVANGKEVFSVVFSPDGQRIVTGGQEEKARVWDAISGNELFPLEGHSNLVWAVAFSEDGQRIITGSWDQTAKVWDADTGEDLRTLIGHRGAVLSVAFSPDGQRVVTGGQDHRAKVWDAASGTNLFTLKGHSAAVFSVSFSRDGQRIITSSDDQTARLWDAASGEELRVFKGHGSRIGSAALSPDGQRIVTGGGAVRFAPEGIFFNPTAGDDQAVKVWDATDTREVLTLSGHEKDVVSVDVSADGRFVASGSFDGTARVWDIRTGQEVSRMTGHEAAVRGVAFFPDGKRIVTGGFDGTARIWDIASRREIHRLEGHTAQVFSVAVSLDSRWIATSGWDHTVRVWDAVTGQQRHKFHEPAPYAYGVAFSPDSRQVGSANLAGIVRLWDPVSGKEYPGFRDTQNIWSLAFSRDGRRIVTGSHGLIAKVWDTASGQPQITLEGHAAHIMAAVFSPDGRRIVTGSVDQTAKLWDADSGSELLTLKGHSGTVYSVAFTPDGQRIVTASGDRTIKIWEAASDEQAAKWQEEGRKAAVVKQAPANPH